MTTSRSPMVSIPAVTRQKSVKGLLTADEKSEFTKRIAHLGMNQQDVLSHLILWWMDQHEDVQNIIVRPSVFEPALRDPIKLIDPAYEYKIIEDCEGGNPDSKFELDELGKRDGNLFVFVPLLQ